MHTAASGLCTLSVHLFLPMTNMHVRLLYLYKRADKPNWVVHRQQACMIGVYRQIEQSGVISLCNLVTVTRVSAALSHLRDSYASAMLTQVDQVE